MHRALGLAILPLVASPCLTAQEAAVAAVPQPNALRVTFVGEPDTPRSRSFAAFLAERFAAVDVVARGHARPDQLAKADVVLLDWDQQSGVIAWMNNDAARAARSCPLGERDAWRTPTVLLGSAGLNVASTWGVRGSSG